MSLSDDGYESDLYDDEFGEENTVINENKVLPVEIQSDADASLADEGCENLLNEQHLKLEHEDDENQIRINQEKVEVNKQKFKETLIEKIRQERLTNLNEEYADNGTSIPTHSISNTSIYTSDTNIGSEAHELNRIQELIQSKLGDQIKKDNPTKKRDSSKSHSPIKSQDIAVGSALSAIRRVSPRPSGIPIASSSLIKKAANIVTTDIDDDMIPVNTEKVDNQAKEDEDDDDYNTDQIASINDNADDNEEVIMFKKKMKKIRHAKVLAYLDTLAEQKRKEETDQLKAEARQRKRAQLMRDRIVNEASERKKMNVEDVRYHEKISIHGASSSSSTEINGKDNSSSRHSNSNSNTKSNNHQKVSRENLENIVNRLYSKETKSFIAATTTDNNGNPINNNTNSSSSYYSSSTNSSNNNNDNTNNNNNTTLQMKEYNEWKRKHNIAPDTNVFTMTGLYPCVKDALIDRYGWHYNSDTESPFFDMKWALRSMDINQDLLQPWQWTNHFLKNTTITTKVGLLKSLQSVKWLADVGMDEVIPRGYDLGQVDEYKAFVDDFKCQRAVGILRELYEKISRQLNGPQQEEELVLEVDDEEEEDEEGKKKQEESVDLEEEGDDGGGDGNETKGNREEENNNGDMNADTSLLISSSSTLSPTTVIDEVNLASSLPLDSSIASDNVKAVSATNKKSKKTSSRNSNSSSCIPKSKKTRNITNNNSTNNNNKSSSHTYRQYKTDGPFDSNVQVNAAVFEACKAILTRVVAMTDTNPHTLDQPLNPLSRLYSPDHTYVQDFEWFIVENYNMYTTGKITDMSFLTPTQPPVAATTVNTSGATNSSSEASNNTNNTTSALDKEMMKRRIKYDKYIRETAINAIQTLYILTTSDCIELGQLLNQYALLSQFQMPLSGTGARGNNLWIVKPAAMSRGRGICTFADLTKLLKYVEVGSGCSYQSQWIVQKYMENPLIIAKRKFDLRQWVVVTDWNPLTIYFYNECYARFTVDEYDCSIASLENSYAHLVNNSIGKNSENFNKTVVAENGVEIAGYMWSYADFGKYIQYHYNKKNNKSKKEDNNDKDENNNDENNNGDDNGNYSNNPSNGTKYESSTDNILNKHDLVNTKIQPRMKEIAKWSLMCASEMIEHRKNSFELYGFDFMIDEDYNTWLIEINSSPACDYSTKVTERYVQKALVELLQLILEKNNNNNNSTTDKTTTNEKPSPQSQTQQQASSTPATAAVVGKASSSTNNNNNNNNNNTKSSTNSRTTPSVVGGWECIYKGPTVERPMAAFGVDLSVKGDAMHVSKSSNSNMSKNFNNISNNTNSNTGTSSNSSGTSSPVRLNLMKPPANVISSSSSSSSPSQQRNSNNYIGPLIRSSSSGRNIIAADSGSSNSSNNNSAMLYESQSARSSSNGRQSLSDTDQNSSSNSSVYRKTKKMKDVTNTTTILAGMSLNDSDDDDGGDSYNDNDSNNNQYSQLQSSASPMKSMHNVKMTATTLGLASRIKGSGNSVAGIAANNKQALVAIPMKTFTAQF